MPTRQKEVIHEKIRRDSGGFFDLLSLDKLAPLEQILFLDIETTGFTSRTSYLYMIGCAYYQAGKWRTIQWMADDYSQEGDILTAFF